MRITALLVLLLAGCNPAMAQTYPSKPVTLIVPYAPGGGTDIIARLTAQALFEEFGQSFIVDNRGGGGGMIGVEGAARATPDGYTLLFSSTGPVTISPVLFKSRDFDPLARLVPIVEVASNPTVLVVRNGLPAAGVDELAERNIGPDQLAAEIAAFLAAPRHFYEVLKTFEDVPHRTIVQAWALLREADRLAREVKTGKYVLKPASNRDPSS